MAEAMARGFLAKGITVPEKMCCSDPNSERKNVFKSLGITTFETNEEVRNRHSHMVAIFYDETQPEHARTTLSLSPSHSRPLLYHTFFMTGNVNSLPGYCKLLIRLLFGLKIDNAFSDQNALSAADLQLRRAKLAAQGSWRLLACYRAHATAVLLVSGQLGLGWARIQSSTPSCSDSGPDTCWPEYCDPQQHNFGARLAG